MRIVTFKSVIVKLWIKAMLAKSRKILRGKPLQSGRFTGFLRWKANWPAISSYKPRPTGSWVCATAGALYQQPRR